MGTLKLVFDGSRSGDVIRGVSVTSLGAAYWALVPSGRRLSKRARLWSRIAARTRGRLGASGQIRTDVGRGSYACRAVCRLSGPSRMRVRPDGRCTTTTGTVKSFVRFSDVFATLFPRIQGLPTSHLGASRNRAPMSLTM